MLFLEGIIVQVYLFCKKGQSCALSDVICGVFCMWKVYNRFLNNRFYLAIDFSDILKPRQ